MNNTPIGNQPPPLEQRPTPGLAVASLVLGIMSMIGASILIFPTVLAIVFGHVAYARIQRDRRLGGASVAMAGFILGYVSILFGVFSIGLLAAMAVPAFQKVREESLKKAMQNDARQIGAAAQQFMIEDGEKPIHFHIDPSTGIVTGPLSKYGIKVSKGTEEVDGDILDSHDGFSLRNPNLTHGNIYKFDSEGRPE